MSAQKVTSRLNKHFWPPLVEDGFVNFQSREYDRLRDATLNAVRIQPLQKSMVGYQHVAEGSFLVQLGVSYVPLELGYDPETFYNPGDLGVCNVRGGVTAPPEFADSDPLIWDIERFGSVDTAIDALLNEFEHQGGSFFATWNDAVSALSELDRMPSHSEVARPYAGKPYIFCAGEPGSISRVRTLSTLAARVGDRATEVRYLREAVHVGAGELHRRRLEEIAPA